MIETKRLCHHVQRRRLWAAIGRGEIGGDYKGPERRRLPRFLVSQSVCQVDVMEGSRERTINVTLHDVCASGACVLSTSELPITQAVRLHPPANAPNGIETIHAHVISCKRRADRYRIGVRFDDT